MTNAKIVEAICADQMKSAEIEKFFKACLDNMRKTSLGDILPAACHVAATTKNFRVYSLASDIINEVWMRLKHVDYFRFERAIYNIYWPRIQSIENIEAQLGSDEKDRFFWDAMSWIRSLRYTKCYNYKLGKYFEKLSKLSIEDLMTLPRELRGRPLEIRDRKATSTERVSDIIRVNQSRGAMEELAFSCSSVYDAREIMNMIISKSDKIELDDGVICINLILQTCRNKSVRKYMLRRLQSERFFFAEGDFSDLFMSACVGIQSDKEYEILKGIAPSLAAKNPNIKATLKLARENLAIEKFQRESIRNSEVVKKTIRKYRHLRHV